MFLKLGIRGRHDSEGIIENTPVERRVAVWWCRLLQSTKEGRGTAVWCSEELIWGKFAGLRVLANRWFDEIAVPPPN